MGRILCVAEKPSIAKQVAGHLGGTFRTQSIRGNPYVKNYEFDYNFGRPWGHCNVKFTSVTGHLVAHDFPLQYKRWEACNPSELFDAPIETIIADDKTAIADNIKSQARWSDILYIWTDCDREGENIGAEIRDLALKANPRLQVRRARFSNTDRSHVIQAASNPGELDEKQATAVAARIELDLRTGAAITRQLTLNLRPMVPSLVESKSVISYGSCQFPTLGIVVDRYFQVQNFVPEPFWLIKVAHKKEDTTVNFKWKRVRLFDRLAIVVLYERCLNAKTAKVTKMEKKPTSKWKPLPLTTLELQTNGTKYLRMNSQRVMQIAEALYTKGFISYPRTETDRFDQGMDLRALVQKQTQAPNWGQYAQGLLNGGFQWPRAGRHDDKAHPPIHPVNYVAPGALNSEEQRLYEFVVRRFLACCSEDAKGVKSTVEIEYGSEAFHANGLIVLERNYLDVYPYDKWTDSEQLPNYTVGETFVPTEALMKDSKTSPPRYITEPELLKTMDANGIGTDATMQEHITKIQERNYVTTREVSRSAADDDDEDDESVDSGRRGGRGGRRGGRGRGGRANGATRGSGTMNEFIPTNLGVALIEGYDNLQFETSLSKPFLRKEMELQMTAICQGTQTRTDVVQQNLERYRAVFSRTTQQMDVLKAAIRKYILEPRDTANG